MNTKVLLVTVNKMCISGIIAPFKIHFISTNRERIINFLEDKYKIK